MYLDSSHQYENTKREILAVIPKIKKGGLFTGHDFVVTPAWKSGVVRPVLDAVQDGLIKIVAISEDPCPSYMAVVL